MRLLQRIPQTSNILHNIKFLLPSLICQSFPAGAPGQLTESQAFKPTHKEDIVILQIDQKNKGFIKTDSGF